MKKQHDTNATEKTEYLVLSPKDTPIDLLLMVLWIWGCKDEILECGFRINGILGFKDRIVGSEMWGYNGIIDFNLFIIYSCYLSYIITDFNEWTSLLLDF